MLTGLYDRTDRLVAKLCQVIAITGGLGLIFAIVITCASIFLKLMRRLLDATLGSFLNSDYWSFIRPILGEEELVQYAVGFALFSALPWAMYARAHIKIDLLESVLCPLMNKVFNLIGDLIFAGRLEPSPYRITCLRT